jgi:hypothetical protein
MFSPAPPPSRKTKAGKQHKKRETRGSFPFFIAICALTCSFVYFGVAKPRNPDSFEESGEVSSTTASDSGAKSHSDYELFGPGSEDSESSKGRAARHRKSSIKTRLSQNTLKTAKMKHFLRSHCGFMRSEVDKVCDQLVKKHGFDKVFDVLKWRRNNKVEFKMTVPGFWREFRLAIAEFEQSQQIRPEVLQMLQEAEDADEKHEDREKGET